MSTELLPAPLADTAADYGVELGQELLGAAAAALAALDAVERAAAAMDEPVALVRHELKEAAERLKANAPGLRRPARLARRAEALLSPRGKQSAEPANAPRAVVHQPGEQPRSEARAIREATQKVDDMSAPLHALSSTARRVQAATKPLSISVLPWQRLLAVDESVVTAVGEVAGQLRALAAAIEQTGPPRKSKKKGAGLLALPPALEAALR